MSQEHIPALLHEHTELGLSEAAACPWRRAEVKQVLRALGHGEPPRAIVVDGPRQVGKSVVLNHVLAEVQAQESGAYGARCDFTDPRLGTASLTDVADTAAALAAGRPVVVFLDEVHHVPEWGRELKFLLGRRGTHFVIADSCTATVQAVGRSEGPGRWQRLSMHPLSFPGFERLLAGSGLPVPSTPTGRHEECLRYLRTGGFPEHAPARGELVRGHHLLRQDVVMQAVRRDVAPLHGIRDGVGLERMLVALLANSGRQTSQAMTKIEGGPRAPTRRGWLLVLEDTGLLWLLPEYTRSEGRYARARSKVYAVDPGLVAACSTGVFGPSDLQLTGRLVETAVAQALRRRAERLGGRLTYYRPDQRGPEADFAVEEGARRILVEATASDGRSKVRPLARLAAGLCADAALVVALRHTEAAETVGGRTIRSVPLETFIDEVEGDDPWPGPE